MRVLLCHNYYRLRGGEDQAFESETALLRQAGHEVETYSISNESLDEGQRIDAFRRTFWNRETFERVVRLTAEFRPDVLHCHNWFPMLSPSIFDAAKANGVATVQTLHNFRLGCVNGLLFRGGQVCEDCVGSDFALSGVRHRCYRGSLAASLTTAAMTAYHRKKGTWNRQIDRYICLTSFGRDKFVEIGLPPNRLAVKPNFVVGDPGPGQGVGDYALWIGRLSVEKGVDTLVQAWKNGARDMPLRVFGDGPLRSQMEALAKENPNVKLEGQRARSEVFEAMKGARFLVLPSTCYEGFPMALIESMATGVPAIASRHGAMGAIIRDGETGILFEPGNGDALGACVLWLRQNPQERDRLAEGCRRDFLANYTAEANLKRLEDIYAEAVAQCEEDRAAAPS